MWPYIIRLNPKGLIILLSIFGGIFIFWYYLLFGTKNQLTNSLPNINILSNIDLKRLLIACVVASERGGQQVVKVRNENELNQKSKGKTREGVNDVLTRGDLRSHIVMVQALSAAFPGLRIISEEHSYITGQDNNDYDIIPINVDNHLSDDKYSKLPNVELPLGELTVWIDPLDATKEYSEGLTEFVTTMVCVARNGEPIIGVIHKPFESETYWAWTRTGMSTNIKSELSKTWNTSNTFRAIVSRSHAGDVQNRIQSSFGAQHVTVIPAAGSGYKTLELIKGKADAYIHITLIKKWDICAPNAILNAIKNGKLTTIDGNSIKYGFDDEFKNEGGVLATIGKDHEQLLTLLKSREH